MVAGHHQFVEAKKEGKERIRQEKKQATLDAKKLKQKKKQASSIQLMKMLNFRKLVVKIQTLQSLVWQVF